MFYDQGLDLEQSHVLDPPYLHPAEDEFLQTYDPFKKTSEWVHNIDNIQTSFPPQNWDNDTSSSNHISFYTPSPINKMPSNNTRFNISDNENDRTFAFEEQFLDLNNLPVVLEDITSHKMNTKRDTNTQDRMPLIMCQEDAMDFNYPVFVETLKIENNSINHGVAENKQEKKLILTMPTPGPSWYSDVVNTPEVLNLVEQLEADNHLLSMVDPCTIQVLENTRVGPGTPALPLLPDSVPVTPKSELEESETDVKPLSNRKRLCSEDSDKTYIPNSESTLPRKYKRRKSNVPKKEIILALQSSESTSKVREGCLPKRKESVFSVSSVDESISSVSIEDYEYRVLRDKNNEASRRSRINKKQKDLEMEKLALVLEKSNSTLRAKVAILEGLAEKMRDFFKTIVLSK